VIEILRFVISRPYESFTLSTTPCGKRYANLDITINRFCRTHRPASTEWAGCQEDESAADRQRTNPFGPSARSR
jgi:hypothetical protein